MMFDRLRILSWQKKATCIHVGVRIVLAFLFRFRVICTYKIPKQNCLVSLFHIDWQLGLPAWTCRVECLSLKREMDNPKGSRFSGLVLRPSKFDLRWARGRL